MGLLRAAAAVLLFAAAAHAVSGDADDSENDFWGVAVAAGKPTKVKLDDAQDQLVHITQARSAPL